MRVIGNARKPPAQLDRSGEFPTLIEGGADRGRRFLGNNEHVGSMETWRTAGK